MAGNAEQAGAGLKKKKPQCRNTGASGNNPNVNEEVLMLQNHSTAVSNVIPFRFEAKEVRTLLIDDQPWFVASDVALALMYSEAKDMTRNLDEDEKGRQTVPTPGGAQEMLVINESGLYSAILRSRKAEAKRFKKWVTSEVLPAIRKHGRYEDAGNKMSTLMDAMIGMTELNVIKGLIRDKAKAVPATKQQSFALTMHNRLHTRFNVPRTELIPAGQFEAACNFIGAYALEGEWLPKQESEQYRPLNIHFPIGALSCRREGMLRPHGRGQGRLDVSLHDLRECFDSPCELILGELSKAGYEVEGAWWELRTYRNKIEAFLGAIGNVNRIAEDPHQYAVKA